MALRCACIDVGANTTRLLVADCEPGMTPRTVCNERWLIPLRRDPSGALGPLATEVLGRALTGLLERARREGAEAVRIVATGPLRAATDREAVLAALPAPVEVLDGDEEARLAFAGATAGLRLRGTVGVVDVGGASTEIAVGTCLRGAAWTCSVPVGSGTLALAHLRSDPPTPAELTAVDAAARAALDGVAPPQPRTVLAVGGPASSLRAICGDVLDGPALERALAALTAGPSAEVGARTGLRAERIHLLPAALVLLATAARALGGAAHLAGGGVREGVVSELAAVAHRKTGT